MSCSFTHWITSLGSRSRFRAVTSRKTTPGKRFTSSIKPPPLTATLATIGAILELAPSIRTPPDVPRLHLE